MKRLVTTLLVLSLGALLVTSAQALVLTGNESDFPPASLIQDDSGDTELFDCGYGPTDGALDIGKVYALIEGDYLYIGLVYQRYCFCDIQIGIALQTAPGGNAVDPFNRQIVWGTGGSPLPDYVIYDVIPTSCNGYNYEVIYKDNGTGGWTDLGSGPNYWGFVDPDGFGPGFGFKEFCIPLDSLGIPCDTDILFEAWITQDDFGAGDKGAFDLVFNDQYPGQQKSQLGGPTLWNVPDGQESLPVLWSAALRYECPIPVEATTWGRIKSLY